jgi:hypothetical protein
VRVGIVAAVAWGHVSQQQAEPIAQRYDRVVAMLYKLVRA